MTFEPKPRDWFSDFYTTYYDRCRKVGPKLLVIAAKWNYEDLIPGLSDFDARMIYDSDVSLKEWLEMSAAVGEVHEELARKFPDWARVLEHPPGPVLTIRELTDPLVYYPEFQQWSFYRGDDKAIERIGSYLASVEWSERDEYFFLKKFAVYFGPYDRKIDPPVNIGKWENKYPLHSRFMHYFTPPVQAAVSLIKKQAVRGKFEALRYAREMLPMPEVIDMLLDAVDRHYEIEEYYREPKITEIERLLEDYLKRALDMLTDHVAVVTIDGGESPADLRKKMKSVPVDTQESFYDGVKFVRFMKGRLLFYAQSIPWFESDWLIDNELGRMGNNFFTQPLETYGKLRFGDQLSAEETLDRLVGSLITPEQRTAMQRFFDLVIQPIPEGKKKNRAREIAAMFDAVQRVLEDIRADISSG